MFQRRQSIYIGLAIILSSIAIVSGVVENDQFQNWLSLEVISGGLFAPGMIIILLITSILISIFSLVSFSNRKKQMKLCLVSSVLAILFYGLMIANTLISDTSIGLVLHLVLASFIFLNLAKSRIKKDEDLVKSVDRIR